MDTTDTDKDIVAKQNQELDPVSSLKYTPEGNPSPSVDNIFKPSEVKSSAVVGSKNDFIWMNLDKAAVNISYNTPSLANPGGYASDSPNFNDGSLGTSTYVAATYNLLEDQITLAGKPYTEDLFKSWLINMEIILKG